MRKRKRHLKRKLKRFLLLLFFISICFLPKIMDSFKNYKEVWGKANDTSLPFDITFDEGLTTMEKLNLLSEYDTRIGDIVDNYDAYPQSLLEMLTCDLDMLDFVYDYPSHYGQVYSDTVGTLDEDFPLFLQWDKRWGYARYGDSSVAISGCGPTALTMVYVALTKDTTMTPAKMATFSYENGYYFNDSGTSWSLMTEGARKLGLQSYEVSLSKSVLFSILESGQPIICSVRPGDFTTTGHFIVLTGIQDGKIKVNDPNSKKRSSMLWEYERLEGQIKNLWTYTIK